MYVRKEATVTFLNGETLSCIAIASPRSEKKKSASFCTVVREILISRVLYLTEKNKQTFFFYHAVDFCISRFPDFSPSTEGLLNQLYHTLRTTFPHSGL